MGAHSKGTSVLVAGVLMAALGCGSSDDSSRTVSASDVSNLPSGNAIGNAFSGVFRLDNATIVACDCRVGSCSRWHGNKGDTFTLTEMNGALHVVLRSNGQDQVYDGGINRGGDFRVGSSLTVGSNTSYSILTGTVVAGVSIAAESQNTFVGNIGGDDFDCDLSVKLAISYLNAL